MLCVDRPWKVRGAFEEARLFAHPLLLAVCSPTRNCTRIARPIPLERSCVTAQDTEQDASRADGSARSSCLVAHEQYVSVNTGPGVYHRFAQ